MIKHPAFCRTSEKTSAFYLYSAFFPAFAYSTELLLEDPTKLSPLQRLEDYNPKDTSNFSNMSEIGTYIGFLLNLSYKKYDTYSTRLRYLFTSKIVSDMLGKLGMLGNLTTPEGLDLLNEFSYDPKQYPVYNPIKDEEGKLGQYAEELECSIQLGGLGWCSG